MRFIHMADMHFDTPFTFLNSKDNLGDLRRLEQRNAFKRVIEYIKKENIPYLFISGDLYDNSYIRESTIEYINGLFSEIPYTKIYIVPGNHDPYLKDSYYTNFNWNDNVYIFKNEITKIELEDVDIYGFGFDDFYMEGKILDEIYIENREKINILLMHGDLNASKTKDPKYNPVQESKLKELGFDYIALGHIHKREIFDERIAYPGSTISLGFDELGEHGILDVNLNKKNNIISLKFVKIDEVEFKEFNLNVSEINSEEQLIEKINSLTIPEKEYYKIILTGTNNFEINLNKILELNMQKNILKIEDQTEMGFDIEKILKQNNLKSIFVKEMLEKLQTGEYTEEEIKKGIEVGLRALQNK